MSNKLINVHIEAVVYQKNSDGEYVLDTNGDKIIIKNYTTVTPADDYDQKVTITEYYG